MVCSPFLPIRADWTSGTVSDVDKKCFALPGTIANDLNSAEPQIYDTIFNIDKSKRLRECYL
jgi:hypothetical protein